MTERPGRPLAGAFFATILTIVWAATAWAAPYADHVIDARTGEVLHSQNADTRLHPASLTKMMTLYIAFQAVERGEISLDTRVTVSKNAASEPPSKLGLKAGQKIALRYLIRAAAVKSANDAATAIGEAIAGSESAFAARMNRTAQALGMTRTSFKNAHGLTSEGHLSTARDMTTLGRHLFYDFPQYYNIFSRVTTDAGGRDVYNTNRKFLAAYKGADGIKTGYTNAAGFNLVASAERGNKRVIAALFGGTSTPARNARMAELLDIGFQNAPTRVATVKPTPAPALAGTDAAVAAALGSAVPLPGAAPAAAPVAVAVAVAPRVLAASLRPVLRPVPAAPEAVALAEAAPDATAATATAIVDAVASAEAAEPEAPSEGSAVLEAVASALEQSQVPLVGDAPEGTQLALVAPAGGVSLGSLVPRPRPGEEGAAGLPTLGSLAAAPVAPEVVTRISTAGGRHWGINIGNFTSRDRAERMLLQTALAELGTLDEALRKVVPASGGFEANFVGLTEESAALACRRLAARDVTCSTFGPS